MKKSETDLVGGAAPARSPDEPERFSAKLLKPHTHAGKDLLPGETIEITAAQRTWLQSLRVIGAEAQEK